MPGRQAPYQRNRYSPAIRAQGLLFVSGQVGSRDDVLDVTLFVVDPAAKLDTLWKVFKVIAKLPDADSGR